MILENPATGETYEFLADPSPDEVLRLRWTLLPGGRVPEHIHPAQEESFELEAGAVMFVLNGEREVHRAGERIAIPAGAHHWFANETTEPAAAIIEISPALRMKEFFETFSGLARDGKVDRSGRPRNPLQLAVAARGFWREFHATFPPVTLQRVVLPLVAPLGRLLGYRDTYQRYAATPIADHKWTRPPDEAMSGARG